MYKMCPVTYHFELTDNFPFIKNYPNYFFLDQLLAYPTNDYYDS